MQRVGTDRGGAQGRVARLHIYPYVPGSILIASVPRWNEH